MGLIRLLLAGAVLVGHLYSGVVTPYLGPQQAVQAFFVISGFYMALVLQEKYARIEGGARVFFCSRFARLYPSYSLVALMALGLQAFVYHRFHASIGTYGAMVSNEAGLSGGARLLLGLLNVSIVGQDWLMFFSANKTTHLLEPIVWTDGRPIPATSYLLLSQTWSLATELTFYALAPWLVARSNRFLASLLALSLAGRGAATLLGLGGGPLGYHFFPFELAFFLCGIFSYRLYRRLDFQRRPKHLGHWLPGVVLAVASVMILLFRSVPWFTGKLALLMGLVTLATPVLFAGYGRSRIDRWLGDLSYPVYLVHPLVGYVLGAFGEHGVPANVGLSLLASAVIVAAVERPLDRRRQARLRKLAEREPVEVSPCTPQLAMSSGG